MRELYNDIVSAVGHIDDIEAIWEIERTSVSADYVRRFVVVLEDFKHLRAVREQLWCIGVQLGNRYSCVLDFTFERLSTAPKCDTSTDFVLNRNNFQSSGNGHCPMREDDPVNEEKVRSIEKFAKILVRKPTRRFEVVSRILELLEKSLGGEQSDLVMWLAIFLACDDNMLPKYLESRSSQIYFLAASYPLTTSMFH